VSRDFHKRRLAMRKLGLVAVVATVLAVGGFLGATFNGQSARAGMPGYKVIEMSAEDTDAATFEKMLNEQAADGWRLHSEIDERLFIFERR
jgi:hypothetical protein